MSRLNSVMGMTTVDITTDKIRIIAITEKIIWEILFGIKWVQVIRIASTAYIAAMAKVPPTYVTKTKFYPLYTTLLFKLNDAYRILVRKS